MTRNEALYNAKLAVLAYSNKDQINWDEYELSLVKWIENKKSDTQGFVAIKDKSVYVVWRGSESKKDFQNDASIDKVPFIEDGEKVNADLKAFFDMKITWDVLMLTTCSAVVIPEHTGYLVSRISSSTNGAGYLVNRSIMTELVELFDANVDNLFYTKSHWIYQNDILWKSLMPTKQWYMFNHYLGYQRAGYSDLSQDQKIAILPQILEVEMLSNG